MNINFKGAESSIKDGADLFAQRRGISLSKPVTVLPGAEELRVIGGPEGVTIEYGPKAEFFRGLALAAGKQASGAAEFEIREKRQFKTCGAMIDCSRNGVLKVDTVKDMLAAMAAMGLDMLMLYTEDIYEVDGYPYFGYMRGRYSKDELKDMDRTAAALGIELVPCIQTLAHLRTALRWPFADGMKDTDYILLAGEEKTYEFIDAMFRTVSECFSTRRIHIGMDEAADVGLGEYLRRNGYQDRYEILTRHLDRVVDLARKHNLQPMMWSDMFFSLGSKTGLHFDLDVKMPEDIERRIPKGLAMVYWDYYHSDEEFYRKMIKNHRPMGREVIFAGGVWTWPSLGVNYRKTFRTTKPGLDACRREGIEHVFATMWGDDGTETDMHAALLGLQLYAEYNYYGSVSDEHLAERFKLTCGCDMEAFLALQTDDYPEEWIAEGEEGFGVSKQVLYQDPLQGLFDKNFESIDLKGFYADKMTALAKLPPQPGFEYLFEYQRQLVKVLWLKCDLGTRLSDACRAHKESGGQNTEPLRAMTLELDALYKEVSLLHKLRAALWERGNKVFGFDKIDLRFGGLLARLNTARRRIGDYLEGRLAALEDLECPRLMYGGGDVKPGRTLMNIHVYDAVATASSTSS
ncbi:MAG: beta-N-acetylhexosaminidase [Clostridiales bacterium]|jgi:hypothetical protein|nr:beta-N-acetylhexosaminidase [Clostridiales bacterium]